MTTECPQEAHRRRRERYAQEWAIRRHLKEMALREPTEWQETHSPSEPVEILVRHGVETGGKKVRVTRHQGRRRVVDARLWESWTDHEQIAANRIHAATAILARGMGYQSCALAFLREEEPLEERVARSAAEQSNLEENLLTDYWSWGKESLREQGTQLHNACLDVLVLGKSCREADKHRRVRKGTVAQALLEGLNIYVVLKGWPRRVI